MHREICSSCVNVAMIADSTLTPAALSRTHQPAHQCTDAASHSKHGSMQRVACLLSRCIYAVYLWPLSQRWLQDYLYLHPPEAHQTAAAAHYTLSHAAAAPAATATTSPLKWVVRCCKAPVNCSYLLGMQLPTQPQLARHASRSAGVSQHERPMPHYNQS